MFYVCQASVQSEIKVPTEYSFPILTQKLLVNLLHFITSVHVCVFDLSHLFLCVPGVISFGELPCVHLSPPQEGGLECVRCGRSPFGRGKCSCAAASLWHANRAFLSAGRVVPMHTALRETGGLQHSSGKFWDQQITVLLPPLTCRHWPTAFSISLSLPLQYLCSVSLPFCDLHKLFLYLSVLFFILAISIVFLL